MAEANRPDVERILSGLKPFQRRSVDYVFNRLYGPDATPRFLLADEVGLGKTLVARGVIARAVDQLWDQTGRIDNHDIARQNINRLNITGDEFALASRITLLPITARSGELRERKLNFISFTPGTSFDLKSSMGVSTERVLLYHLLAGPWRLRGAKPWNVLQGGCDADNFRNQLDRFDADTIDKGMAELFLANLKQNPKLKDESLRGIPSGRCQSVPGNFPAEERSGRRHAGNAGPRVPKCAGARLDHPGRIPAIQTPAGRDT
jgi:hypothetical protein